MIIQSDLISAINAYETATKDAIQRAKDVILPSPTRLNFSTLGLKDEKIVQLSEKITTGKKKEEKGSEFLYVFRLAPSNTVAASVMVNAFNQARAIQDAVDYEGKKNLCKFNQFSPDSKVLYVGRSYGPRERFKSHLRQSTSGTYAIHFGVWASRVDLTIDFYLYKFSGIGNPVVQLLEDGLWDHFKPIFGRRGER